MELNKPEVNEFLSPTDNQAIFRFVYYVLYMRAFSVLQ